MKTRGEIDSKYKIDTKDLFTSDAEFDKEFSEVKDIMNGISKYQNILMMDANTLNEALKLDTEISKRIERLYIYAHLNNDFDLSEERSNKLIGRVIKMDKKYMALSSYIIPELLESDYSLVEKYIKENDLLKEYERNIKEIFRLKSHVLSKKEELLLKQVSEAFRLPNDIHSKLLDADLTFGTIKDENGKKIEITSSNYATYIESNDRRVRKDNFDVFYKGYKSIINTTSEALASEVKNNNVLASIRNYNSALEASLIPNNVDPKVYDTLLKSIDEHLDIIHEQWSLRKQILGIDKLHIYDTYVPLIKNYDATYTFDEGRKLVEEALSVLGSDYAEVLHQAFDENWIDVYPTKNKRSGGYCTACYLAHPYVFLNFDGRYDEVSTIAHELGHAMHYYYAAKNNTYEDYGYSIFVAEVASQVNELLLSYYMLEHSTKKEEKLFILDELIKRFKASTIRQSMFAEFERNIHEMEQNGTILTKEKFSDEYYKLNQKYYGPDVFIDEDIKYEWSRIPHFYYDFYVYQYSTGYISALKIANDILKSKPGALENYLKFLGLGSTLDPVSSLKVAGVDLTDQTTFDDAFKEFAKTMADLKKLNEME